MKTLRLAALLAALATPAWADNEDFERQGRRVTGNFAAKICAQVGGNEDICKMRHSSEEFLALVVTENALKNCKVIATDATPVEAKRQCAEILAYIKQRWGY